MDEGNNYFEFGYTTNQYLISPDSEEILFKLAQTSDKKEIIQKNEHIPLFIYREGLSALRATVKFLKENRGLTFTEISKVLNRNVKTIWTSYNLCEGSPPFSQETLWGETLFVPISIISSRELSVLESLSKFLRKSHTIAETARLLGKSPKTIWTVLDRSKNKRRRKT